MFSLVMSVNASVKPLNQEPVIPPIEQETVSGCGLYFGGKPITGAPISLRALLDEY
jgi:hypothetical protein